MSDCKCNMREKLVGDGCDICNPAKALEYANETIAELTQQRDELAEALRPIAERGEISAEIINKARAVLTKHRQPEEAPELFPGTLDKLRGLGRVKK